MILTNGNTLAYQLQLWYYWRGQGIMWYIYQWSSWGWTQCRPVPRWICGCQGRL